MESRIRFSVLTLFVLGKCIKYSLQKLPFSIDNMLLPFIDTLKISICLSDVNNLYISGTSISSVSCNKCSADAMSKCTDPLKVVTDNKDLGFATSKDELDEMCP